MILQDIETMTDAEKMALVKAIQENVASSKAKQVSMETGQYAKLVVDAIKKIKTDLEERYAEISAEITSKSAAIRDGVDGINGAKGEKGDTGLRGLDGANGKDGKDGKDGIDGSNGNGVLDARIDFDGSLIITLDNGNEINAGEVVPLDIAEKIKVVGNGGGTSQYVLDLISALQAQVDSISPTLVITDTFVVGSQAALLALTTAEKGDVAVRTDLNKTFILKASPYSTLANWQELLTPTDSVTSVNGYTGTVVLTAADVSAVPYTGATTAVDLNNKTLTNVSRLGINTTAVSDILFRAVGDNNSVSRMSIRGYSSDANSSSVRVTKFRGTTAAPQAPQSGDSLGKFELAGYGTTSSSGYPQASFEGVATEAWGAIARGTKTLIKVTPNGTTTQVTAVTIDQDKTATFAGAISVTGHTTFEGITSTGATGTGKLVYDTSPTLITPLLGTPTSGNLANCTFPTLNQNTTGTASNVTGTVAIANGGTGATTASAARTGLGLVIGTDVLAPNGSAAALTSFPTFNQNTTGSAGSVVTTGFSIVESGGKLLFKYGATTIASMSSTGIITSAANIVSNGTP
jgi:hypothetical protein